MDGENQSKVLYKEKTAPKTMNQPNNCIPWMTTTVGHLPAGEKPMILEVINTAMPLLWRIGGDKRLKTEHEGLHIVVARKRGKTEYCGEFQHSTRSVILDAGSIRGLSLNRWRGRLVGLMAHEITHVRQFFRAPVVYSRLSYEFSSFKEYWEHPTEVAARFEEGLVRRALGLPARLADTKMVRQRVEEYREAFGEELLPMLRMMDRFEEAGGSPTAGIPLSKRQIAELLDDLTNYMSVRTIRSWDSRTQASAARWWLLARGTSVSNALERRWEERKGVWLGSGMTQRTVQAEMKKSLPVAAEKLVAVLPTLTPSGTLAGWDAKTDYKSITITGLAKFQDNIEKEKEKSAASF